MPLNQEKTEKKLFYLGLFVVLLYLFPYLILGKKSFLTPHDMWDSNFIWWKILVEQSQLFSPNSAIIPNMMNGLPRSSFPSQFNLYLVFEWLFPTYVAFVINLFLIHIIAYLGMLVLLKHHF